jgi:hypothetical protein
VISFVRGEVDSSCGVNEASRVGFMLASLPALRLPVMGGADVQLVYLLTSKMRCGEL